MLLFVLGLLFNTTTANAIIGGEKVSNEDPIAQTTVMLIGQTAQGGFSCTGTILNQEYILTAAHCVIGVKAMVVVFATDAPESSWSSLLKNTSIVRSVVGINHNIDYPNTDVGGMYPHNDIGLVRFVGGVPSTHHPVMILDPKARAQYLTANAKVTIAGYGQRTKGGSDNGFLYKETIPFQRAIAEKDAYVGESGRIACHGDSGGPAFVNINGRYYQWGVASRSNCETFSIYTPLTSNFYGQIGSPSL